MIVERLIAVCGGSEALMRDGCFTLRGLTRYELFVEIVAVVNVARL